MVKGYRFVVLTREVKATPSDHASSQTVVTTTVQVMDAPEKLKIRFLDVLVSLKVRSSWWEDVAKQPATLPF